MYNALNAFEANMLKNLLATNGDERSVANTTQICF